jgi:hypothetical protein
MIDFKCPELWEVFNSRIDPGGMGHPMPGRSLSATTKAPTITIHTSPFVKAVSGRWNSGEPAEEPAEFCVLHVGVQQTSVFCTAVCNKVIWSAPKF